MAACINRDQRDGKRVRLLREFVRNFRGLTSSAKLAAVLDELGLSRARLDVFFVEDKVDHAGITRLLAAMQQHSKPVKPERLGLIGRDHFARLFAADGADPDQIKYSRELGHRRRSAVRRRSRLRAYQGSVVDTAGLWHQLVACDWRSFPLVGQRMVASQPAQPDA